MQTPVFGGDRQTTNLDLILSVVTAFGLPFACAWLFGASGGAWSGLLLYYLGACIVLVWWRKGGFDYHWPQRWPWGWFVAGLVLTAIITLSNWGAYPDYGASTLGLWLTLLVWAPLNGALEQLSWQYVLDAWRNRWPSGWQRRVGLFVGIILILALVALIHILFWSLFLPLKQSSTAWLTPVLNIFLTVVYVMLYLRSRSMWPTFIIHTLVDLQLVALANYSIWPDL
jgi:membrane protease YdiL (CAAX protease family)